MNDSLISSSDLIYLGAGLVFLLVVFFVILSGVWGREKEEEAPHPSSQE
jgi:hypothetical protein